MPEQKPLCIHNPAAKPHELPPLPVRAPPRDALVDEWERWLKLTPEDIQHEVETELPALRTMSPADRRRAVMKMCREKMRMLDKAEAGLLDKKAKMERLSKVKDAYEEIVGWATAGIRLEKADASQFRAFRKDVGRGAALHVVVNAECDFPSTDYEKEYLRFAEAFVVQHDWAAAFANAKDMDGASFRLPYDTCAFEFQISGRRVIALATESDERVAFTPAVWTSTGWLLPGFVYWSEGGEWTANQHRLDCSDAFDRVVALVGNQLRAICIALDAEIATTHVERAAHVGQHSRNSHAEPKPYHVVSLARRERALALASEGGGGRKRRLHFRRGHWRHYETFKTWVKWTLVGDPDLGFVDKEYRL